MNDYLAAAIVIVLFTMIITLIVYDIALGDKQIYDAGFRAGYNRAQCDSKRAV